MTDILVPMLVECSFVSSVVGFFVSFFFFFFNQPSAVL